jgi:hypothetical protein
VEIREQLDGRGYALTDTVLSAAECRRLIAGFDDDELYRSTIDMQRHRFGSGTYRYFAYPLPSLVQELRTVLYPHLAKIAGEWPTRLGETRTFPATLDGFLRECHAAGQARPTPLVFRYREDDFNALHQDVYGKIGFPLQAMVALDRPGTDFTGGEFLLVTQIPRSQSVGTVVSPDRGQLLIFPNATRPLRGARGWYRGTVRHGVSAECLVTSSGRGASSTPASGSKRLRVLVEFGASISTATGKATSPVTEASSERCTCTSSTRIAIGASSCTVTTSSSVSSVRTSQSTGSLMTTCASATAIASVQRCSRSHSPE